MDWKIVLIKMDCKGIGWHCVDWVCLNEDKDMWWSLVNMVMHLHVPRSEGIS